MFKTDTPGASVPAQAVWGAGLLTAVAAGVLFLSAAWVGPLQDPDETRCALIVQSSLRQGHWIVPQLEGKPYLEKPAAFFWLAAAGQRLTGDLELGGRLVAGLSALAAVMVAFDLGRRRAGAAGGVLAGMVLATGALYFFLARWYRMDMPFTAAMWAAVWWFARDELAGTPRRAKWTRPVGFYLLAGVATLFKGPAGVVLPVTIVGVYLLWDRQPRRLAELLDPRGLAVWAIVVVPYYLAAELQHAGFLRHFLVGENVQRFTGASHGHHWGGLIYLPVLAAGMWPWTVYLPGAIIEALRGRQRTPAASRMDRLLWSAVLAPLVLFSLSGTKLAHYILPCVPPLALLIALPVAGWVQRSLGRADKLYRLGTWAMVIAVACSLASVAGVQCWLTGPDLWLAVSLAPAIVFLAAACIGLARGRRGLAMAAIGLAMMNILLLASWRALPAAFALRSHRTLAQQAAAVAPNADLCYFQRRRFSFPLYAGQLGARRFDEDRPQDVEQLVGLLTSQRPVACLVDSRANLERLLTSTGADKLDVRGPDAAGFWLVTNRPGGFLRPAVRPSLRPNE